jgi:hypothetical protein
MDGTLLEAAVAAGADGLVVAATGAGNTSPGLLEAATRAMDAGLPVALTTRCGAGQAGTAYAFPGGGATWVRAGAMLAGSLSGPKARAALALGIGAGLERDACGAAADPGEQGADDRQRRPCHRRPDRRLAGDAGSPVEALAICGGWCWPQAAAPTSRDSRPRTRRLTSPDEVAIRH